MAPATRWIIRCGHQPIGTQPGLERQITPMPATTMSSAGTQPVDDAVAGTGRNSTTGSDAWTSARGVTTAPAAVGAVNAPSCRCNVSGTAHQGTEKVWEISRQSVRHALRASPAAEADRVARRRPARPRISRISTAR